MTMYLKKFVALLLALTTILVIFSACGKKEEPSKAETPTETSKVEEKPVEEPAEEPEEEKEPINLTVWVTSHEDTDFQQEIERDFMEAHPHITLNKVMKEGNPNNEFYQAVAIGNAPDLTFPSFNRMKKYMQAGILEPLDDYVATWDEWQYVIPEYSDMITYRGNLYGVPSEIATGMFAYNKRLFEENGLDHAPATWEEALEMAKIITDPSEQIYGYATTPTSWFFQYYVWQAGGNLTLENPDGTIELTFTDPAVIAAGDYYQELFGAKVCPSDLSLEFTDFLEMFAQGKLGMMSFSGDWVGRVVSQGMKIEDIGLCAPPAGPSGKGYTSMNGVSWSINAGIEQEVKDAAWEYITWFQSHEQKLRKMEHSKSLGAANPTTMPRTDLDVITIYELPDEYQKVLEDVKLLGHDSTYGRSEFGVYIDHAIQKLITDPNADPLTEFQKAQDLAETEALDGFNEEALEAQ